MRTVNGMEMSGKTYMKTLHRDLSLPWNGRRLWRNEISGIIANVRWSGPFPLHRIQRNVEWNGVIRK